MKLKHFKSFVSILNKINLAQKPLPLAVYFYDNGIASIEL